MRTRIAILMLSAWTGWTVAGQSIGASIHAPGSEGSLPHAPSHVRNQYMVDRLAGARSTDIGVAQTDPMDQEESTPSFWETGRMETDFFYLFNSLERYPTLGLGKMDAQTVGSNLSLVFGEKVEIALSVPIYNSTLNIEGLDTYEVFTSGADVSLTFNLTDNFSIGGHGNVLSSHSAVDNFVTGNVGVFTAYERYITEKLHFNARFALDFINPNGVNPVYTSAHDRFWTISSGAGVGIEITSNWTVTPFFTYFRSLSGNHWNDLYYAGIDSQFLFGERFVLNFGYKEMIFPESVIDQGRMFYVGAGFYF